MNIKYNMNEISAYFEGKGVVVTKTNDKYKIKGRDGKIVHLHEEDIALAHEAITQLNRYNRYLKEDFDNAS